jgi:endonuclease/exonuclease/phosphatase family metal-dependent hydrolase
MKILTWNVNRNNKLLDQAVRFIRNYGADIICLQEFSVRNESLLAELSEFYTATEEETLVFKSRPEDPERMYSVVLSKYPILKYQTVPHKNSYFADEIKTDRYQFFQAHSFFVDIDIPDEDKSLRIFNVHFKCVAGPHHRLSQFRDILSHFSTDRENIICGDFNTFGSPLINVFLWKLFGYQKTEVLIDERTEFATEFEKYGLQNPFQGAITFLPLPAQLDYILVSKHTPIKQTRHFLNPRGSDHLPIMLEI